MPLKTQIPDAHWLLSPHGSPKPFIPVAKSRTSARSGSEPCDRSFTDRSPPPPEVVPPQLAFASQAGRPAEALQPAIASTQMPKKKYSFPIEAEDTSIRPRRGVIQVVE